MDSVSTCADCPGDVPLISAAQMHERGLLLPDEEDVTTFVAVGEAEDPLTAQELAQVLQNASIPVLLRQRQGGLVDKITDGTSGAWFELRAPAERADAARKIVSDTKASLASTEEDAARAAEEEEAEEEARSRSPGG
jgi:hypothetical protein